MGCRDYSEYEIRIYRLPSQGQVINTVEDAEEILEKLIMQEKDEDEYYDDCFASYDGCQMDDYYKSLIEAIEEAIKESRLKKECLLVDGYYDIGDDCDIHNYGVSDTILICNGEIKDKKRNEYEEYNDYL